MSSESAGAETCADACAPDVDIRHYATGRRLELFTIAWNALEAVVALVSGILAGSASLVGFGVDSVIKSSSGGCCSGA